MLLWLVTHHVAPAAYCANELRVLLHREFVTQARNDYVEAVIGYVRVEPPGGFHELTTGHDLSCATHQKLQKNVFLVHQQNRPSGAVQFVSGSIQGEAAHFDPATQRLFVNLRATKKVASVDLSTKSISQIWTVPDLNLNTPMALDGTKNRLFVAGRKPGKFYVLNSSTGAVVFEAPCINIADYMVWDPKLQRIYVTGTQGISVFHQIDGDHYEKVAEFPTNGGKISAYVPALQQFYIVHPKTDVDEAGLQVFHVNA